MKKLLLSCLLLISWQLASAVNITFSNDTAAVVHVDYVSSNCSYVSGSQPDTSGDLPYHSTVIYSCADQAQLQFAQYGAGSVVQGTPKCYLTVNGNNLTPDSSNQDCNINGNVATLQWQTPQINSVNLVQDPSTLLQQFLNTKPAPATGLLPNVVPLNSTTLSGETAAPGWQLQYGYDATRFPLWNGADCLVNDTNCSFVKPILANLLTAIKNQAPTGDISSTGYWAYTISNAMVDGQPVTGGNTNTNSPALDGPLAVAELSVNGSTNFYNNLINNLYSYSIAKNAPSTQSNADFMTSTSPYFNATLDLLSEALLVGNGSFNLNSSNEGSGYVSYSQFIANYNAWKTSKSGFLTNFTVSDQQGNHYTGERVIFSVETAPHANQDSWTDAGVSPTVSEGMAYGLLISYAADDQATFDQLLNFIVYEAQQFGCAGMSQDQTSCSIKTNYLTPWMVDQTGQPFHYMLGGGYLTNGSATDADMNIVWALTLANQRWGNTGSSYLMDGITYHQLAQDMAGEMAFFDINQNVSFMGGNYLLYSPGSQWGASGEAQIYPGYYSPQALEAIGNILNPQQN